ncbi:MAG: 3-hydroxybutyryl-CoA dehydrogenase [Bacteroidetes bacterium]|nr:3-hydroxybutyryl-CoA dehydrogenase [Bacteroidota bacterium]
MVNLSKNTTIGVIGAGTMGAGIAQVSASSGHPTVLFDANSAMVEKARTSLKATFAKLVEKGKYSAEQADAILGRIVFADSLQAFSSCGLIIEAIIENLGIKKEVFTSLEKIVSDDCILATNTSSLSVTSIAAACRLPQRIIGIHFFNPAPLMPLVEVIPGIATAADRSASVKTLLTSWGKSAVTVKDTPGFIVNRVARSYYGESIRIYEESWEGVPQGIDGFATIDLALKTAGGFKMGPFELMDMIGNDINFTVTETVWTQFFYDARFKPSLTQERLFEAGRFGKKSGAGYYDYSANATSPKPLTDSSLQQKIFRRVIAMLINEAVDALYLNVASRDDLDLAMMKGVNYPKGLLQWCDEIGAKEILQTLTDLHNTYLEERYRPSVLLRKMAAEGKKFYS